MGGQFRREMRCGLAISLQIRTPAASQEMKSSTPPPPVGFSRFWSNMPDPETHCTFRSLLQVIRNSKKDGERLHWIAFPGDSFATVHGAHLTLHGVVFAILCPGQKS
jgi:hypothetical protein